MEEKENTELRKREEEQKKSIIRHYMRKTQENTKAVSYEKLLCEEVMLTTAMKPILEYNVGKNYTRFKLVSWYKKEVYVKQYKTSGKPVFNGEHFFLKIASKDTSGNDDFVHMKVFKPGYCVFLFSIYSLPVCFGVS